MRHVRVTLDLEEALDLDCTGDADAREVVAPEIDEHDVLGAVLFRGEQPLGVPGSALGRARDRVQARTLLLGLDEGLRGGADQRDAVELEQEEVRGRIYAPQSAAEIERRR